MQTLGAINVLMERFSEGFKTFPPHFLEYFPTHFEHRFCIDVHEKLQLRVRVEGVIYERNTLLHAEFDHKIPHNPNTQIGRPHGLNLTLKDAQKRAF